MKNTSIKVKVTGLNIVSIFVVSFMVIVLFLNGVLSLNEDNLQEYKTDLMESRKAEIRSQVQTASKAIEILYNESKPQNIINYSINKSLEFKKELIQYYNKYKSTQSKEKLLSDMKVLVESRKYNYGAGYYWIADLKPSFNDKDSIAFTFEPFGWTIATKTDIDNLENKLKQEAIKIIANLSYSEGGYFWINDILGNMISHPNASIIGKNFANDEKTTFVQLGIDIANTTGEGFANYTFPKEGSSKFELKIS